MKTAAFFDLDGTLLTVNSGRLWIRRERREGRISLWQLGQAAFYMVGYHFGAIDMEKAMDKALGTIKGLPESEVRAWTEGWYDQEVKHFAAPGGWQVIDDHREQDHPLVLLTSSSPYEARAATKQFGMEHTFSTSYEVRDGRFTGRVNRPICFGAGKVTIAESFAAEHEVDLDESYFYSDSITDLPMLERVGYPMVVAPDPRLRREALRRGWPQLDWSKS